MITKIIEAFKDDFTVCGYSFYKCLHYLTLVLRRCIETNLVLNFKNLQFKVEHGVALGHVVFIKGIEVDKAKVDIIQPLPYPQTIREVRSFLGHFIFFADLSKAFLKLLLLYAI